MTLLLLREDGVIGHSLNLGSVHLGVQVSLGIALKNILEN